MAQLGLSHSTSSSTIGDILGFLSTAASGRGHSIAPVAAIAAAGLTVDVSPTLLRTSRDGYQGGDENWNNEWPGYTSDLLNMLDMLPDMHRNESIRVRYGRTPIQTPRTRTQVRFSHNTKGSVTTFTQCPVLFLPKPVPLAMKMPSSFLSTTTAILGRRLISWFKKKTDS